MHVLEHLEAFKTTNTLQKAAYAYIGSQLATDEDRKKIDAVFRSLDLENNGRLNKKELKQGYWHLYGKVIAEDELESMMKNLDLAGDGYINYSEFIAASLANDTANGQKRIEAAFEMFDKDGTGLIKAEDLREIFHAQTGDEKMDKIIEEIISKTDTTGNSMISLNEFTKMMHSDELTHHK
jgi:calcium-dependent protein kinase